MPLIPFFDIHLTQEMKQSAIISLENEKFVMGESVYKFEEEFAKYIGTKHAISVNSGQSALQLSLMAFQISSKSKVLTSTNSFIASANCILAVSAEPILCDVHLDDGNINVKNTSQKSDAIIPVHIYGNPCDFKSIQNYAEDNKIPIIEDACQAHGAEYEGKKVGSIGDVGCFSFYPTKNMTVCGDGGMITTNNDDVANTVSSQRDNGRSSRTEHDKLGFTMRLNTVSAAIGRIQLKNLDKWNTRRREIAKLYQKNLSSDILLKENPDGKSVYHQIVLKHKNRDKIMNHLSKKEIGSMIHYPIPIHMQPLYQKYNFKFPNAEEFAKTIFSVPSFPGLSNDQVKEVCEIINEVLN